MRFRRSRKTTATMMAPRTARPPITPPTIAPTGVEGLGGGGFGEGEGMGVGVGDGDGVGPGSSFGDVVTTSLPAF